MPAWPLFETLVGLIVVVGAIYYVAVVRRQAPDAEGTETDVAETSARGARGRVPPNIVDGADNVTSL